jgi:recombinational DNA repair protein (RecF pathway)
MDRLGYRPKLETCASCEKPAGAVAARFLPLAGAVVCVTCEHDERALVGAQPLRAEEVRALQAAFDGPSREAPAVSVALAFLEAHLDRPLATLAPVRAAVASEGRAMVYSA